MTDLDPLSQLQVEDEIRRLSRTLTDITEDVAEAATNEARTEVAYKLAHARKLLDLVHRQFKGTVAEKEATCLTECAGEFEAMKIAEAIYKACRESGQNVRAQLGALQTIAANVRQSVAYSQGRGG